MKINTKQKRVLLTGLLISIAAIIIWLSFGAEIFTKTKVLVETKDEIFGDTKEWKDHFVLGLDYTLGFIAFVNIAFFILVWKLKSKS
ncbi:MAG: hypothetical protein CO129_06100 [Ignavibacteriales bacterium CG_4_9_14_3_um_filter_34_10]|nr:MAG: hypothetical protein CO129_06100 [Ignavibacteriales bacterium CG_4_9_14_3_um_filter_34_10]